MNHCNDTAALLLTLVLLACACCPGVAENARRSVTRASLNGHKRRVVPGQYIVTLADRTVPSMLSQTSVSTSAARHAAQVERASTILKNITDLNLDQVHVYSRAFSGFSFRVPEGGDEKGLLASLRQDSQVISIKPVRLLQLTPHKNVAMRSTTVVPSLLGTGQRTGIDNVKKSGVLGTGVKVGIVDTGLDYTHPALGGCFGPLSKGKKCRVVAGFDFVGDDFDNTYIARPDKDPMDCDGHGTHVAGIVGANATASPIGPWTGVAPGVVFGAYRVLSCQGQGSDDTVLQGLERAAKDGMNVINLSLGTNGIGGFASTPLSLAVDKLVAKGIIVVAAAGNDGGDGLFMANVPGVAASALSVASVNNWFGAGVTLTLDIAPTRNIGTEFIAPLGQLSASRLVGAPFFVLRPDACFAELWPDLRRAVVLSYLSGPCGDAQIGDLANQQPLLVLFYEDNADPSLSVPGVSFAAPYGFIPYADGDFIMKKLLGRGPTRVRSAKTQGPGTYAALPNGGGLSAFSSYGPEATMRFKPDIAAPGGSILSTIPRRDGSWAFLSGTSMATPFMAGCAALWRQARLDSKRSAAPAAFLKDLSTTAQPAPVLATKKDVLESPVRAGAGLVQMDRAIGTRVALEPPRFVITTPIATSTTRSFTVVNSNAFSVQYSLGHRASRSLQVKGVTSGKVPAGKIALAAVFKDASGKKISAITVPASRSAVVKVTLTVPNIAKGTTWLLGGYLTLTPVPGRAGAKASAAAPALSLPYFTLNRRLQDVPALDESLTYPVALCVSTGWWMDYDCYGGKASQRVMDCAASAPLKVSSWSYLALVAQLQMSVPRVRVKLYSAASSGRDPKFALLGTINEDEFVSRYIESAQFQYQPLDPESGWGGRYRDAKTGKIKMAVAGKAYAIGLEITRPLPFDAPKGTKPVVDSIMTCRFIAPKS